MIVTKGCWFYNFRLDVIFEQSKLLSKQMTSYIYVKIIHIAISDKI